MMVLEIEDWRFRVDVEATRERTSRYSFDHCECGYCKNFYDAIDLAYPFLRPAMEQFGVNMEGPSELMPFKPTLMLACYRVDGEILEWGRINLGICGIPLVPEAGENGTFLLWLGEMSIPWLQEEAEEDVISPANLPEFMARMQEIWSLRHESEFVFS